MSHEIVAGLVYYPDSRPGIRRERRGTGFSYLAPDGTRISNGKERQRLEAIAVPPAYENVWISPRANGHLQATGYDSRKRKQYRYHPDWSSARAETKYAALAEFGSVLPRIRRCVARDLEADAGELDFALAAAVTLIDRLSLRIGQKDYARENGSYGALSLRRRHLKLNDQGVRLDFTAKGGTRVRKQVSDRTLLRTLERASDLSGAELITWIDQDGTAQPLNSSQLNQYLGEISGVENLTAKTFRTWAGTLAAFELVETGERPTIEAMSKAAAKRLHNTAAVARQSYIHPSVIDLAGKSRHQLAKVPRVKGLSSSEGRLLALLKVRRSI